MAAGCGPRLIANIGGGLIAPCSLGGYRARRHRPHGPTPTEENPLRTRNALPALLVAGCVFAACNSMPRARGQTDASGETVWIIDWTDDDGEFESDPVIASRETADPLADEGQLKQVTSLGQHSFLYGFDVHPERRELLMSIVEGMGDRN